MTPRATVYCVYRQRNSAVLERLLAPAIDADWTVVLWALDEPDASLAELTAGSGPGTKFELVNHLLDDQPPDSTDHVVVADDDAVFIRGNLVPASRRPRRPGSIWPNRRTCSGATSATGSPGCDPSRPLV